MGLFVFIFYVNSVYIADVCARCKNVWLLALFCMAKEKS